MAAFLSSTDKTDQSKIDFDSNESTSSTFNSQESKELLEKLIKKKAKKPQRVRIKSGDKNENEETDQNKLQRVRASLYFF